MKITMRGQKRDTGITHKIADERINPKNVALEEDGQITVGLTLGPIHTTGNFKAKMTMSLSELHYLIGILEERKLELLLNARIEDD